VVGSCEYGDEPSGSVATYLACVLYDSQCKHALFL
jgi:hypothetical protein